MILKSVSLRNFMCYSGENLFEFSEGLNVIIGDNGYGKSKIYDGIYWVMYDKCFDSNGEEKTTQQLGRDIVSDKAEHDADDGPIECSVQLTFYDNRKEYTYTLERKLMGNKRDDKIIYSPSSNEKVTKKTAILSAQIVDDEDEIARIKKRILPNNIKPYMWFQGEQINNIVDFRNSETLTNAINVLSDISKYDEIASVSESLFNSVDKELKKKQRSLSTDKEKSDELEKEINRKKSQLYDFKLDLKKAKEGHLDASGKAEDLVSKLDIAQKIKELDEKRLDLESKFNSTVIKLREAQQSLHKKIFTRGWILKGTEGLFKAFEEKKATYDDAKLELRNKIQEEKSFQKKLQTRLPENVPEPVHVNKMLEQEKCLVCDREAPKGSAAYKAIKSLLEKSDETLKSLEAGESRRFNFSSEFENLYRTGLQQEGKIKEIDQDISESWKEIDKFFSEKEVLKKSFGDIEAQLENYISESSISAADSKRITNEVLANQKLSSKYSADIGSLEHQIGIIEKDIKRLEDKYAKLVVEDLPDKILKKFQLATHLNEAAKSTRKRVFKELISQLESEANKHYLDMTKDNLSARGIIRLSEYHGNYTPELVDNEGNPLAQLNTGNTLLIKLATIMAIISARKSTRDTYLYTLIADAPMSSFGEDYTLGFCKTVSQVYTQSIIMSKDFYKNENLRSQLLNDSKINLGKVYIVEPNLKEKERQNRLNLVTHIKQLN